MRTRASDLRRARYVIEHYPHLQGLRLVPLAACFLGSAAWRAGLLSWLPGIGGAGARIWFLASVALALVVSVPIGLWYRRHIGAAVPPASRTGAATVTISSASFVLAASIPANRWHVSVAALFAAIALAYVGCVEQGLRRHYLAVAAGCLLFAMAPALGVPRHVRSVALDLLVGAGLIVAGVGDHLALRRALQRKEGLPDVRTA